MAKSTDGDGRGREGKADRQMGGGGAARVGGVGVEGRGGGGGEERPKNIDVLFFISAAEMGLAVAGGFHDSAKPSAMAESLMLEMLFLLASLNRFPAVDDGVVAVAVAVSGSGDVGAVMMGGGFVVIVIDSGPLGFLLDGAEEGEGEEEGAVVVEYARRGRSGLRAAMLLFRTRRRGRGKDAKGFFPPPSSWGGCWYS